MPGKRAPIAATSCQLGTGFTLPEGAGVACLAQLVVVVAAELAQQLLGVLAAGGGALVGGAEAVRRGELADFAERRVLVADQRAASLDLRVLERVEHLVDAAAGDALQPFERLVGGHPPE